MSIFTKPKFLDLLSRTAEDAWFAYPAIILLQVKVMFRIWEYRDLTPGDSSEYYTRVYTWLDKGTVDFVWSPIYTVFLGILHKLLNDPFWVMTVAQVAAAVGAAVLTLALLRRLLPKHIAWIIAAWWTLLPINFDTVYNVHLFSTLFPLAIFVIAAYADNIYGRGIVLGGLLLTAVLVRNEYSSLFLLWLLLIGTYEFYTYRRHRQPYSFRNYATAYGVPMLAACLTITAFYAISSPKFPELEEEMSEKHTVNVCQIYAYNRLQQGDSWQGDPWSECRSIIERDFGQADITFSGAFFKNPRAILEHIWWNFKLIPSGTQLALFNYYWGGNNPDYMTARHSPVVWLPFFLVFALAVFGAATHFIFPCLKSRKFHWKKQAPGMENSKNVHGYRSRQIRGRGLGAIQMVCGQADDKGDATSCNRLWFAWLLLLSAALLVFGIMMMQRPRPSYMFLYSIFIMALTGLGLHHLFMLLRLDSIVRSWWPLAGILLILLVPSYYNADYVNDFSYRGQTLRNIYRRNVQNINRTTLPTPAVFVAPTGNYTSLCNYLGIRCRTLDMEGDLSTEVVKNRIFADPADYLGQNIYIIYFDDMIWKVPEMVSREGAAPLSYVELHCFSLENNVLTCRDGTIDLASGFMNDGTVDIPLRSALFVDNGYVINRLDYRTDAGYYLQVLQRNRKVFMILVTDDDLFRTNFNQQFLLGKFDRRYFEEVRNNYPITRVLKVKGIGE